MLVGLRPASLEITRPNPRPPSRVNTCTCPPRVETVTSILHDLRHALRSWRNQPSLVGIAVLTLALGIGVNVVVFGLVEALVLRPLPAVADAGRVLVTRRNPFSYQAYRLFAGRQRTFDRVAVWQSLSVSLFVGGGAQPAQALVVSSDYFPVLGVAAARGRLLASADEEPGETLAAVISERCWRLRFDGALDVIGRTVTLNQTQVAIVGVAPAGFNGTELGTPVDLFLPVSAFDSVRGATGPRAWVSDPAARWLRAIGRLRPGVTPAAARAEGDRFLRGVAAEIPSYHESNLDFVPLVDAAFPGSARDSARRALVTLLGVAACVLLVACANVANLLLASGERRRIELGVRLSLGVTPRRLAAQLLTETLLLVAAAFGVALLLARWTIAALSAVRFTAHVPVALAGVLDLRVALGAMAVAAATTLACGLAPAWHGSRTDLASLIGRGTVTGGSRRRVALRDALVAAQVAASVLLVVGAILFVTTLRNQEALPAGFKAEGVAVLRVNVRPAGYAQPAGVDFYRRLEERVRALPGVVSVGRALNVPLGETAYVRDVGLPGVPAPRRVLNTVVSPGYFAALGIPFVEGRDFEEHSEPGSVIVNETLARQTWPGRSAVGQALEARDRGSRLARVIGVVRDSKYESLQEERTGFVYTHAADDYDATQVIFARTAGAAEALIPGLREAVRDIDPRVPILALETLGDHVETTLAQPRAAASLVTAPAGLAAVLAAVGLHGVLSFIASTRRREMAIRLALGARAWHVVASLAGRSGLAVGAGLVVGIAGAVLLERFVSSLLYGVRPAQPWVLALAGAITLAVGVLAAAGPAVRAIRSAPALALRE